MTPALPKLLSVKDAAAILGLSSTAIRAMCEAGELPHHRIGAQGGRIKISESDLAEYLEKTRVLKMPMAEQGRRSRRPAPTHVDGFAILRAAGWSGKSRCSS